MTPDGYLPVEGRLRGPLYSVRLYIGENHLLLSTVAGVHENYKRYAWEDIQAFTLRPAGWGTAVNAVFGFFLFCLAMAGLAIRPGPLVLLLVYLPLAAAAGGILAYNIRRGPTCEVRVRTAVSDDRLGSLHRVELARRELDKLKAIVLAKQAAALDAAARVADYPPPVPAASLPQPPLKPLKPIDSGLWHRWALVMLAANLAACLVDLAWPALGDAWDTLIVAVALGNMGVAFGVLLSQARRASTNPLRVFGWLNFAYNILMALFVLGMIGVVAFDEARKAAEPAAAGIDFDSLLRPFTMVDCVLVTLLLGYGILAVSRYRPGPTPPPAAGA